MKDHSLLHQRTKGSALIITIFVLVVLVGLVVSLGARSRVELKSASNFANKTQSQALAEAGLHLAMAVLQNDSTPGQDDLTEDWALLGSSGTQVFDLGNGHFQVQIIDASSRLNINTATQEQLLALPGMTEEIAEAILDWRDNDDNPRTNGAESEYYQTLQHPYNPKNGPFNTLEELLLVKGMTPSLLYGDPTEEVTDTFGQTSKPLIELLTVRSYERNEDSSGQRRQNLNSLGLQELMSIPDVNLTQEQAQAIIQRRQQIGQFNSVADLLDVNGLTPEIVGRLYDHLTTTNAERLEGRININTADTTILLTLPGMTEEIAQQIIDQRPYANVGELLTQGVLNGEQFRQMASRLCTKSSVFIIRSIGYLSTPSTPSGRPEGYVALEALVERTNNGVQLLRKKEVRWWPGWKSWGWGLEAST